MKVHHLAKVWVEWRKYPSVEDESELTSFGNEFRSASCIQQNNRSINSAEL